MTDKTIDADVLIVGGGGAGLRAAVEANERGGDVIVLSKGVVGKSGLTQTAVTGFQAAFGYADPRDNPDVHFEDSVRGGYFLPDQSLVEIFTKEAPQAVLDLERFGARFDRGPDGRLLQKITDESQTYPRSVMRGDALGIPIMRALRGEVSRRKIRKMNDTIVTKILVNEGKVAGATGLDIKRGEFILFRTNAIIMATGGAGELFSLNTNTPDSTGDGYSLAYEAGAELVDIEFILFLGHAVLFPEAVKGSLYTFQRLYWHGAKPIYNSRGEPFVSRYDPLGRENPAREIYARAIFYEVLAGRGSAHGGAYFNPGSVPFEVLMRELPRQTKYLMSFGVDMRKPIEVGLAAHYFCGGIRINGKAETTLPGLYAAGEVSGGVHGAARIGGNSLAELFVFGKRAGKYASDYASGLSKPPVDMSAVDAERQRVYDLLKRKPDRARRPCMVKRKLQELMWRHAGIVRNEEGLKHALGEIRRMKEEELPEIGTTSNNRIYNYEWIEALEVRGMLNLAEAVCRSALLRRESRGSHYREDHPEMNNTDWMKNIVLRLENGEVKSSIKPITVTRNLQVVA